MIELMMYALFVIEGSLAILLTLWVYDEIKKRLKREDNDVKI